MWTDSSLLNSKDLHWSPPSPGIIKLNVDATILLSAATIDVIARNNACLITKAWAKSFNSCDPMVAEVAANLWAIQLAKVENLGGIIVESDSKVCADALLQDHVVGAWNISVLCNDAKVLATDFSFCNFYWVKREANMAAHTLAKLVLPLKLHVIYFPNNLQTL